MTAQLITYRQFQHWRAAKLSERAAELEPDEKYQTILQTYAGLMRSRAATRDRD